MNAAKGLLCGRLVHQRCDDAALHDAVGVQVVRLDAEREADVPLAPLLHLAADQVHEGALLALFALRHVAALSPVQPRTTASAMRATRAISLTSCTRTMSAPLAM